MSLAGVFWTTPPRPPAQSPTPRLHPRQPGDQGNFTDLSPTLGNPSSSATATPTPAMSSSTSLTAHNPPLPRRRRRTAGLAPRRFRHARLLLRQHRLILRHYPNRRSDMKSWRVQSRSPPADVRRLNFDASDGIGTAYNLGTLIQRHHHSESIGADPAIFQIHHRRGRSPRPLPQNPGQYGKTRPARLRQQLHRGYHARHASAPTSAPARGTSKSPAASPPSRTTSRSSPQRLPAKPNKDSSTPSRIPLAHSTCFRRNRDRRPQQPSLRRSNHHRRQFRLQTFLSSPSGWEQGDYNLRRKSRPRQRLQPLPPGYLAQGSKLGDLPR